MNDLRFAPPTTALSPDGTGVPPRGPAEATGPGTHSHRAPDPATPATGAPQDGTAPVGSDGITLRIRLPKRVPVSTAVAGAVLVTLAVGGFWGWRAYNRGAPERALVALANAVQRHDTLAIEQAVDFSALSRQVVDEAMTAVRVETLRDDGASAFGITGAQALDQMAPTVARSLEISLRASVRPTPDTASEYTPVMLEPLVRLSQALGGAVPVYSGAADTAALAAPRGPNGIEWLGFTQTRFRGPDTALVAATLRDRDLPASTTLTFRMVRRDGAWTLVGMDRVGDALVSIRNQRQQIVDRYNREITAQMAKMIEVGSFQRRYSNPDGWGINEYVIVGFPITNRSGGTIRLLRLMYRDGGGDLEKQISLTPAVGLAKTPLPDGATHVYDYYLDYNRYIDWHSRVRYGTFHRDSVVPTLAIVERAGEQPDTLMQADHWLEYSTRVLKR